MKLITKRALSDLIGAAYDAAGDAALWEVFLGKLAQITRADSAALVMHYSGREQHAVVAGWKIDPKGARVYSEYFGFRDIWAQRAQSKPPGHVCTSESLCPQPELASTEFYNDFLARQYITHGLFAVIEKDVTRYSSVSLYRDVHSGEFDENSDLKVMGLISPHVQRAFTLHFQLSELQARTQTTDAALNMLTVGVIFVGSKSEIVQMNSKADELLRHGDGLLLVQGELSAGVYAEGARLKALIDSATQTSNGKGMGSGGTLPISRKNGRPLAVTIAPLRNVSIGLVQQPAAVLFISDPDHNVELSTDFLHRCYGLTKAEARLASTLAEGHSLKEAADLCGVTHNTVKSQLKSIFLKTNVQRQSQLVRLVLSLPRFRELARMRSGNTLPLNRH